MRWARLISSLLHSPSESCRLTAVARSSDELSLSVRCVKVKHRSGAVHLASSVISSLLGWVLLSAVPDASSPPHALLLRGGCCSQLCRTLRRPLTGAWSPGRRPWRRRQSVSSLRGWCCSQRCQTLRRPLLVTGHQVDALGADVFSALPLESTTRGYPPTLPGLGELLPSKLARAPNPMGRSLRSRVFSWGGLDPRPLCNGVWFN